MPKASHTLLAAMPPVISFVGKPVRAAGWYGPTRGLHTVAIRVANFRGRLFVEASLALAPQDDEWFSVLPDAAPYIEFPRQMVGVGETATLGFSFRCNCLWLRARMDRSHIAPATLTEEQIAQYGRVDFVRVIF